MTPGIFQRFYGALSTAGSLLSGGEKYVTKKNTMPIVNEQDYIRELEHKLFHANERIRGFEKQLKGSTLNVTGLHHGILDRIAKKTTLQEESKEESTHLKGTVQQEPEAEDHNEDETFSYLKVLNGPFSNNNIISAPFEGPGYRNLGT